MAFNSRCCPAQSQRYHCNRRGWWYLCDIICILLRQAASDDLLLDGWVYDMHMVCGSKISRVLYRRKDCEQLLRNCCSSCKPNYRHAFFADVLLKSLSREVSCGSKTCFTRKIMRKNPMKFPGHTVWGLKFYLQTENQCFRSCYNRLTLLRTLGIIVYCLQTFLALELLGFTILTGVSPIIVLLFLDETYYPHGPSHPRGIQYQPK